MRSRNHPRSQSAGSQTLARCFDTLAVINFFAAPHEAPETPSTLPQGNSSHGDDAPGRAARRSTSDLSGPPTAATGACRRRSASSFMRRTVPRRRQRPRGLAARRTEGVGRVQKSPGTMEADPAELDDAYKYLGRSGPAWSRAGPCPVLQSRAAVVDYSDTDFYRELKAIYDKRPGLRCLSQLRKEEDGGHGQRALLFAIAAQPETVDAVESTSKRGAD